MDVRVRLLMYQLPREAGGRHSCLFKSKWEFLGNLLRQALGAALHTLDRLVPIESLCSIPTLM
ncbi:hypothetical protein C4K02_2696 [Pseudomonas synxantha]|nr:hypothetical protein C4K02_2696 [Pseudomonas synxantha]